MDELIRRIARERPADAAELERLRALLDMWRDALVEIAVRGAPADAWIATQALIGVWHPPGGHA